VNSVEVLLAYLEHTWIKSVTEFEIYYRTETHHAVFLLNNVLCNYKMSIFLFYFFKYLNLWKAIFNYSIFFFWQNILKKILSSYEVNKSFYQKNGDKVGSPKLSDFFSAPYRTATDRLSFEKIPQNQRKTTFYIKTFGVF
jgi:hypothetical protein